MALKLNRSERLKARTALVFAWRPDSSSLIPKLLALGITAGIFSFLLVSLQVRVITPGVITGHDASLMMMPSGPDAEIWASKAREGGPFPSRFEPSQWPGAAAIEAQIHSTLRQSSEPYEPQLRDLPTSEPIPSVPLTNKGVRVFPPIPRMGEERSEIPASRLMPALYPLSGLTIEELPESLPPFETEVTGAMTATPWRFLIRLLPDGGIAECTSLAGADEPGAPEIQNWLRGVKFRSETASKSPWIAVAIVFNNLQADGTDAR